MSLSMYGETRLKSVVVKYIALSYFRDARKVFLMPLLVSLLLIHCSKVRAKISLRLNQYSLSVSAIIQFLYDCDFLPLSTVALFTTSFAIFRNCLAPGTCNCIRVVLPPTSDVYSGF